MMTQLFFANFAKECYYKLKKTAEAVRTPQKDGSLEMADTIYEIYTDDSGAFTVGSIAAQNENDYLIKGVDEEGKISAYYCIPKRTVVGMTADTPYLHKVEKYMRYGQEHPYSGWFTLPALTIDPEGPILTQVLRAALKEGSLITAGRSSEEELVCGYVREVEKGRVLLDCVDLESAQDLTQVRIRIKDLEFIEYGSISNMLLQYANQYRT